MTARPRPLTISLVLLAALSCGAARPDASNPAAAAAPELELQQQAEQEKQEQEKKKEKEKKPKRQPQDEHDTSIFSDAIANSVMRDIRDGLEGRSQRLFLSAFDSDKMDGWLSFEDQIQSFFERHENFRLHYRITQSTIEGARGVILVDMEMEQVARGGAPQRRRAQMRFELERGRRGWKVVDFRPREFFS